jgi:spore maturation protein B
MVKKVPVYESFTEGAKDGFKVAVTIIPYLVAIIVGISMLRASGSIEMFAALTSGLLMKLHIPTEVLPIMMIRPLSGSAVLGLFSDIATTQGIADFTIKLAAVMVGSSETTFYVLSVYFGAVGVKKFRYALAVGLIADVIGAVLAIVVCSWMFL